MTVSYGVDFSSVADVPDLASHGVTYGLSRCVQETGTVDPSFAADVAAMRAAGLIAGGYAWLVPAVTRDVKGQVHQYIDAAGPFIESGPFLTQLDVEPRSAGPSGPYGPPPTFADVRTWIDEFHVQLPGKHAIPYGGYYLWGTTAFGLPANAAALLGEPFWLSRYPFRVNGLSIEEAYLRVPPATWTMGWGGWAAATFLQFEGTVTIAGVSGSYDLDAARFDLPSLTAFAGGTEMLANVLLSPFPDGLRPWTVAAGTTLNGYDPAQPGKIVRSQTFPTASGANADATAAISWPGTTPAPSPNGPGFLRVVDGTFAGLYIVASQVTVAPAPPAPVPLWTKGGTATATVLPGTPYSLGPGAPPHGTISDPTTVYLLIAYNADGSWVALDGQYLATGTAYVQSGWVPVDRLANIQPLPIGAKPVSSVVLLADGTKVAMHAV